MMTPVAHHYGYRSKDILNYHGLDDNAEDVERAFNGETNPAGEPVFQRFALWKWNGTKLELVREAVTVPKTNPTKA